jgi:PhnB protein
MKVEPYLNFDGRCEEAIEFYKSAIGAEVTMLLRFSDSPEKPAVGMMPPGSEKKVMHASLRIGDSTVMASDCHCQGKANFEGVSLSITANNDAQAERAFAALSGNGGKVCAPLTKTFFSSKFGVATDRFGVTWMIVVEPAQPK